MTQNRYVTAVTSPIANVWNRLRYKRPFVPPQQAIILQPGTPADVMLATPMLTQLKRNFPQARFDWAASQSASRIVRNNPAVNRVIPIIETPNSPKNLSLKLLNLLVESDYDTCYIPDFNFDWARVAQQAHIPQRVGLWQGGRGVSLTVPVMKPAGERHRAIINLSLARLGAQKPLFGTIPMSFYPSDLNRKKVSENLLGRLNWQGEKPLVVMNPGPGGEADSICWPLERFVLLGNRLVRKYQAQLILVGEQSDRKIATEVAGMIAAKVANWVEWSSLGDIGALCEVADLYIGNDCGATHIAATMGCATLALFQNTDPGVSAPYHPANEKIEILWRPESDISVKDAETAVEKLLK